MPDIPLLFYFSGGFVIIIFFLFLSGIIKKFVVRISSHFFKKIMIFSARISIWLEKKMRYLIEIFCDRIIESGLIEGLMVNGTRKVFSAMERNPLQAFDGNVNYYLLVCMAGMLAFLFFL
ncbi:MAG: hypothetical protein K5838_01725 [Elusimicrobiales bacterium]|nr:hypothetical protein [Elusimicrobiales bacterium]